MSELMSIAEIVAEMVTTDPKKVRPFDQVRVLGCPNCGALAGERCFLPSGEYVSYVHDERNEAWAIKYDTQHRELATHERFAVGGLG